MSTKTKHSRTRAVNLTVRIDGKTICVERRHYVKAKTKQLREFGYSKLTEKEVDEQVDAVLAGKEIGSGLTVVGAFMEDEIQKENIP